MGNHVVRYVGYYDTPSNGVDKRDCALSAAEKMDYVVGVLNRLGLRVEVVSASTTRSPRGRFGRVIPLASGNTLRLFPTLPWGGKARRVASVLFSRVCLLSWLLANTQAGENLLVYHSLGYASVLPLAKKIKRFRLILEVEEVYADVTGRTTDRRAESRVFAHADAFVFPTVLLNDQLNSLRKPFAVVHGNYATGPTRVGPSGDGRIHVVYAGALDPRKGVLSAVQAGLYLDDRYHIHVLGPGDEGQTRRVCGQIADVSARTACRVTFDGALAGDEYRGFLQSCHIGLSTQATSAAFNETSFPSKVLSYMANGLRVISIRLAAVEQSGVGDLIFYYDEDEPRAIAQAIREVDPNRPHGSVERLRQLDDEFVRALGRVLGGCEVDTLDPTRA